jgi:hypothetical protein
MRTMQSILIASALAAAAACGWSRSTCTYPRDTPGTGASTATSTTERLPGRPGDRAFQHARYLAGSSRASCPRA